MLNHNEKCRKEGNSQDIISHHDMLGACIVFQFAGADTSKSTIAGLLHTLGENQEIQKNLNYDIKSTILDKRDRDYDWIGDDYKEINLSHYLQYCINEQLRMKGPAPLSWLKQITKNTTLGGYKVYKNTKLAINVTDVHHNPKIHFNPFKFIPERWNEENKKKMHKGGFLGFALGKRACIGK